MSSTASEADLDGEEDPMDQTRDRPKNRVRHYDLVSDAVENVHGVLDGGTMRPGP
ncbi:MAG: hypothetical protein ACYTG0_03860 [Planctomycetota bacterium]